MDVEAWAWVLGGRLGEELVQARGVIRELGGVSVFLLHSAALDGVVGPNTVRALQKKVGAGVDGQWGPDTTRHLQQALNAATF